MATEPTQTPSSTEKDSKMTQEFRLTGWHVLAGFVTAFGIIIAVNVTMAMNAVRTFPGLEVKNSYVASQTFDADRAAQEALGWTVGLQTEGDILRLSIRDDLGQPVRVAGLGGILGRATNVRQDQTPVWEFDGQDYVANTGSLERGYWNLRLKAEAQDGTAFKQRLQIYVK